MGVTGIVRVRTLTSWAPQGALFLENFMRPLKRKAVSKHGSAKKFRRNVSKTKAPNMVPPPMRGGYRL